MLSSDQVTKVATADFRRFINGLVETIESKHLSIDEISRLTCIKPSNIYRILYLGVIPSALTLQKLAYVINDITFYDDLPF